MEKSVQSNELSSVLTEFAAELMKHSACSMHQLMQREGMSMPRLVTLLYLHRQQRATLSAVSEHLNLSLGATSHLVDQLVTHTFVSRVEDPIDRRHKQLALTDAGTAFVEELKRERASEINRRLQALPPDIEQDALRTMRELTDYLRVAEPQHTAT